MFLKSSKVVASLLLTTTITGIAHAQDYSQYDTTVDTTDAAANADPILAAIMQAGQAIADVSETVITVDERKKLAAEQLKNGLINSALENFEVLSNEEGESSYATYGEALALSQVGDFSEAFNKMRTLSLESGSFQEPARKFANNLLLNLGEQSLSANNISNAKDALNQFDTMGISREQREHFERLMTKLNNAEQQAKGFEKQHSNQPLKIAILLPMSGDNKFIGQQMLESAQLALFNKPNPNILLYPHDTQSTEMGAIRAAQKAINDRADIILGPLTAEHTRAISQYTVSAGIPVISFSSQESIVNRYISTIGFNPKEQAQEILRYAADKGVKSAAALVPDNLYGDIILNEFLSATEAYDISITDTAKFDPSSPDQTAQLTQLANIAQSQEILTEELQALEDEYKLVGEAMDDVALARLEELRTAAPEPMINFEALFLPVSAKKLPLIASQLAYYNMDSEHVMILGTGQWQTQDIHKNRAEYIRGAFFAAPPRKGLGEIYGRFNKTYSKEAHPLTLLAFDGVVLLSELYEQNNEDPYRMLESLKQKDGFDLFSGRLRFSEQGTSERLHSIYEVRSYKSIEKEAAPSQFPPELPSNIDVRESRGFKSIFSPWNF